MKKIEIKKFKTAPDLAKMIEEGHKVHAMANGKNTIVRAAHASAGRLQ